MVGVGLNSVPWLLVLELPLHYPTIKGTTSAGLAWAGPCVQMVSAQSLKLCSSAAQALVGKWAGNDEGILFLALQELNLKPVLILAVRGDGSLPGPSRKLQAIKLT